MKIHYVSGSRADFGLMKLSLQHIAESGRHELSILVTGQHLLDSYGCSINDIYESKLAIVGTVPVHLGGESGAEMAFAFADEMVGCLNIWDNDRPDLVVVLGDRGEMLAATLAAVHLGIHVAHIHGGERSGSLDESFRHSISKLAHLHWTATEDAANRLVGMGEQTDTISVIGAPGLVGITENSNKFSDGASLRDYYNLPATGPLTLLVFHPVVQEAGHAAHQMQVIVEALSELGHAILILRANSDAGGLEINYYLEKLKGIDSISICTHLEREEYLSLLAGADLMVGNSSSGIIESASFGTPCLNIGNRQNLRLRNSNTLDCPEITNSAICKAACKALAMKVPKNNLYGDGKTDKRILSLLDSIKLDPDLLKKSNVF